LIHSSRDRAAKIVDVDTSVMRSLARWPDVPAVYGWLALDVRGNWLLRNPSSEAFERIGNAALREFIARNYECDPRGCWYFQNGPQRVYVRLAYTPLVYRLDKDILVDHCGRRAGAPQGAWLDEQGAILLLAPPGVGVLEDRDLAEASERLRDERGAPVESLERARFIDFAATRITLGHIASREVPARFGFKPDPRP
jgi:hypothetical protein